MLTELTVKQFALIEEVSLSFSAGMTAFTGETGAGKSILVDALGAVFGARASSDWVRHGADKAEISAVLESEDDRLLALLKEQDIDLEDQLFLRRVVTADGRSKAYVNGTPTPAKLLQQIGNICLDLHGQHEHQALLQPDFQREIVDARISKKLTDQIAESYQTLSSAEAALNALKSEKSDSQQQETWMRDELKRLQTLELDEGVIEQLSSEVEAGRHVSQIQQAAAEALGYLEAEEGGVRTLMAQASHAVELMSDFHDALREAGVLIAQIDALMSEVEPLLRDALDASFDGTALQAAEDRLMSLHEAMRRHSTDEAGLLALMQSWEEKVSRLETSEWDEERLRVARDATEADYRKHATELSKARKSEGARLTKDLRPFLDRLGLAGMQVEMGITSKRERAGWGHSGWDQVEIMASSNPGEPIRPLAAIASGGELSRFVLALKGCGALVNAPQIAVFDEVDVGIGGETAWCVGELLAAMSQERQLFVVSHLPQVAACADQQVCIQKGVEGARTLTRLQALPQERRQEEIARMLGGANEESLLHAEQMLKRGAGVSPEVVTT